MGEPPTVRVDVAALRIMAGEFEKTAESVEAAARTLTGQLGFDGATAGRLHVAKGDTLRNALDGIADQLARWSWASAEVAAALRAGADRYTDAEARGVQGFR